jgi:predicted glutamine amidotransferase
MCVIVCKQKGSVLPPSDHLVNCQDKNRDGIGVCYHKEGGDKRVIIKKDFKNVQHLIYWLHKEIKKEDAIIIHFRNATVGLEDEGNRHPYPVTNSKELIREVNLKCKMAVAHNGVFSNHTDRSKDNIFSDSQKFVMDILSNNIVKNNIYTNEAIGKLIKGYIGSNKLAFMNKEGKIMLFGDYEKEMVEKTELYYSNTNYKKSIVYYGFHRYHGGDYASRNYYDEHLRDNALGNQGLLTNLKDIDKEVDGDISEIEKQINSQHRIEIYRKNHVEVIGHCENCHGYHTIWPVKDPNNEDVYLCRKCRKKVRKGKLKLETRLCSHCERPHFISNLVFKYNEFPLCKDCIYQYGNI